MKFYIKDSNGEKREVSMYEYFNTLSQEGKLAFNPTYSYDLLKEFRLKRYEAKKTELLEDRNNKGLNTTEDDINLDYLAWLDDELIVIETWLSDKRPDGSNKILKHSASDKVEIRKYKNFVQDQKDAILKRQKREKQPKRNEPSDQRARAFCIGLMLMNGKGSLLEKGSRSRKKIIEFASKTWEGSPAKIYKYTREIMLTGTEKMDNCYKEDYPKEYEVGYKIYKKLYPD